MELRLSNSYSKYRQSSVKLVVFHQMGLQPHLYTFLHNVLTIATLSHNTPVALYTELHLFEQVLFLIEQLMANY